MSRLDWEKANRRERFRAEKPPLRRNAARQKAIAAFVKQHDLTCFSCGDERAEWAKSGISKRGPWVICVPCVQADTAARPRGPSAEA